MLLKKPWRLRHLNLPALFHLLWGEGPHLHDDVPALAERSPGEGEDPGVQIKELLVTFLVFLSVALNPCYSPKRSSQAYILSPPPLTLSPIKCKVNLLQNECFCLLGLLWYFDLSSSVPSPPCSPAPVPQRVVAFCPSVLWQWTGADQRWRGLCPPRRWLQHHGVSFIPREEQIQRTYKCWIDWSCCKRQMNHYLGLAFRESSNISDCKSPETKPASK